MHLSIKKLFNDNHIKAKEKIINYMAQNSAKNQIKSPKDRLYITFMKRKQCDLELTLKIAFCAHLDES